MIIHPCLESVSKSSKITNPGLAIAKPFILILELGICRFIKVFYIVLLQLRLPCFNLFWRNLLKEISLLYTQMPIKWHRNPYIFVAHLLFLCQSRKRVEITLEFCLTLSTGILFSFKTYTTCFRTQFEENKNKCGIPRLLESPFLKWNSFNCKLGLCCVRW